MKNNKLICLFDVDGTLTKPRLHVEPEMLKVLSELQQHCLVGLVGGSDISKITEQMGETVTSAYDYVFAENGLVAYKGGELISKQSMLSVLGEEKVQDLINFCLSYMSKLKLPVKRGNFIEFRTGLINVCPVGRSCSQAEREAFNAYDNNHGIRKDFIEALKKEFPNAGLEFAIGGQISFDVFPIGWDKRYCLTQLLSDGIKVVHFFGDKTSPGGNDYEIYDDPRTEGHSVTCPQDTQKLLEQLMASGKLQAQ